MKLPVFLEDGEVVALMRRPNRRYLSGLRNWCMMALMIDTGIRSNELVSLEVGDVNLEDGRETIREGKGSKGKQDKQRVVWFTPATARQLARYLQRRPKSKSKRLFLTDSGKPIATSYLRQMIRRYALKAKISKRCSPHVLRHTFATAFYRRTKDLLLLQKALGHKFLSTTTIYTHVVDPDLERMMRRVE